MRRAFGIMTSVCYQDTLLSKNKYNSTDHKHKINKATPLKLTLANLVSDSLNQPCFRGILQSTTFGVKLMSSYISLTSATC